MDQIDKKYLKGLKFLTSKTKEVPGKDGQKIRQHIPYERALMPEDVLSWNETKDTIILATADGRKLTVEKSST